MTPDEPPRARDDGASRRLKRRGLALALVGVTMAAGYVIGSALGWFPGEVRYVGFAGLIVAFAGAALLARGRSREEEIAAAADAVEVAELDPPCIESEERS